jgi:transketolase
VVGPLDGHDVEAVDRAIAEARRSAEKPTIIIAKTHIGKGSPNRANTAKAHGEPLGADELSGAKAALGWSHAPFQVPPEIRSAWAEAGRRGRAEREAWTKRLEGADRRAEFTRRMACERPAGLSQAVAQLKQKLFAEPQTIATRKASEIALDAVTGAVPELVLGSADLTGSNNTKTKNLSVVSPGSYGGRYIHYGIREHGMAAAMNGLALHGGFIPAGGTFLVFSDYARPAMRIAALSGIPAIYVLTHDSIGLGEDGPTHQPVEHLAALRAMPNMRVFRPADAVETAECWQLALERTEGPTVLALTRQNLPQIRKAAGDGGNLCAAGAYEISPSRDGRAKATIFASGSEVEVALGAQTILTERGMAARVVSVPSLELFLSQPADVRRRIVGDAPVRVAVEAAVRFGWDALIGPDGVFVGMHGFGASAPYKDLYRHFGITPEAVAEQVLRTHNL